MPRLVNEQIAILRRYPAWEALLDKVRMENDIAIVVGLLCTGFRRDADDVVTALHA
jgi:hypothetical protein